MAANDNSAGNSERKSKSGKKKKGILKSTPGFQTPASLQQDQHSNTSESSTRMKAQSKKAAHYDEMNIIATLHPADKDYGHMKILEPDTPYNYDYTGPEDETPKVDPNEVAKKIRDLNEKKKLNKTQSVPTVGSISSLEDLTEDEKKRRKHFEEKRKAHYNEYAAVLERKNRPRKGDPDSDSGTSAAGSHT